MKDFAVIIPCYNAAKTIGKTIQSVLNQTHQSWSIYIVDDGSTDNTLSVVESFCQENDDIHVLGQFNRGVSSARNRGLQNAKGKYFAFLDADDEWAEDRLETLAKAFLQKPEVHIIYGRVGFFQENSNEIGAVSTIKPNSLTLLDMLSENQTCTMSNVTVRATAISTIGLFDVRMSHGEDREWLLRAIHKGVQIQGINEILTFYRLSLGGLSADLEKMHKGWNETLDRLVASGAKISAKQRNQAEAVYLRYLARRALRMGAHSKQARQYVIRALGLSPTKYFENFHRGLATLIGAFASSLLPKSLNTVIFTR